MRDQAVELGRKRRDLGRKLALQPSRPALADARERVADGAQGHEPDADLDQHRRDQAQAEERDRPPKRAVEEHDVGFGLRDVAGDDEVEGLRLADVLGRGNGERDPPHQHSELLAVRTVGVAPQAVVLALLELARLERLIPQRARGLGLKLQVGRLGGADLPVPAGEDALEARIGEAPLQRHVVFGVRFRGRDQAVEIEGELGIKAPLDRVAENSRKDEAARHKTQDRPDCRPGDQPEGERVGPGHGPL